MWATGRLSTYPQHGPVDPVGNRDVIHQVHRPALRRLPVFDPQISRKTQKKVPGQDKTFMRQAARGLAGTTVAEAVKRVDAWYAANPDRMDVPVLSVLWLDIIKPRMKI